jgi:hypothetical protein
MSTNSSKDSSKDTGGWLGPVGTGLALGAVWGVLARVWMRLVSTAPGFSWTGTLMIIGFAAVAGGLLGLVLAARRHRRRAAWRLVALPGLVLFAGAGIVLLPALLLGGWAWGSRRPGLLRAAAALPLLAIPIVMWQSAPRIDQLLLSPVTFVGGFYLLSLTVAAAAGSVWFAPWPSRVRQQQEGAMGVAMA